MSIENNDWEILKEEYEKFSKTDKYKEAYRKLDRMCYWEAGEYLLILKIYTSKPNKVIEKKWKFDLQENQVEMIRLNIEKILLDTCMIPSYKEYNFVYATYSEV